MIDEEDHKEAEYIGPYLRCPQYKVLPYNLHGIGKFMGEPVVLKDDNSSYPENGVIPDVSLSSNSYATPNGGYSRPVYPQEFSMWSTFYPNSQKVLQNPLFPFEPQLYTFMHPAENQYQYVPLQMFSQGFTPDLPSQEFQYFVVIDFEATCDKEKVPHPQEIIEFPSVLVNSMTGQVEDFFQRYVRPAVNQHLSDFCKELTGIQQNQVDRGVPLKEALHSHDKWLEERGIKNKNFAVVTWSNWDCRVMLESECRFKGLDKPQYFNKWINLKVPFQEVFGGVRCNLKEAVKLAGLAWEGRAHCGLDDARNTARLLIHLMHLGFRFSITNSLPWQSADRPLSHQHSPDILLNALHSYNLKERQIYCDCGVKTSKQMIRKPGPYQGSFFFGCGNWTARRGPLCTFYERASH